MLRGTLSPRRTELLMIYRIIEPLASRCAKFRFKALDPINTKSRIEYIAEQEHVNMQDGVPPLNPQPSPSPSPSPPPLFGAYVGKVVDALEKTSEGDLRKAI